MILLFYVTSLSDHLTFFFHSIRRVQAIERRSIMKQRKSTHIISRTLIMIWDRKYEENYKPTVEISGKNWHLSIP